MTKHYVIQRRGYDTHPWVLNPEGGRDGKHSREECVRSINWQVRGGGVASEWVIAERTGADTFRGEDGETYTVGRGPYTEVYFAEFLAEWEPS